MSEDPTESGLARAIREEQAMPPPDSYQALADELGARLLAGETWEQIRVTLGKPTELDLLRRMEGKLRCGELREAQWMLHELDELRRKAEAGE